MVRSGRKNNAIGALKSSEISYIVELNIGQSAGAMLPSGWRNNAIGVLHTIQRNSYITELNIGQSAGVMVPSGWKNNAIGKLQCSQSTVSTV